MNDLPVPHGKNVLALVEAVERDRASLLKLAKAVLAADKGNIFPLDFLVLAATKRNLSTSSAFVAVVRARNMVCARALLRVHVDTGLRFSAAWLVKDPHAFASDVVAGTRIDKLKDTAGKRLTDAYLVSARAPEYPWLPDVYAALSGYVHFSSSHITSAVARVRDDAPVIDFEISDVDTKFPESSWIEALECFRQATGMLARYLHGYGSTKNMTPKELKSLREDR